MSFLDWLEHSAFSMWVKDPETLFGYDMFLSAHGVGMAILVGLSAGIALRILGFAPKIPLAPLGKYFPVMIVGFWLNLLSGVVLFVIYPMKPVTNPGFYIKLGFIVIGIALLRRIRSQVFQNPACQGTEPVPPQGRTLAAALLGTWTIVITAGRLMAYHGIANVERQTTIAMLVAVAALLSVALARWRIFASAKIQHQPPVGPGSRKDIIHSEGA